MKSVEYKSSYLQFLLFKQVDCLIIGIIEACNCHKRSFSFTNDSLSKVSNKTGVLVRRGFFLFIIHLFVLEKRERFRDKFFELIKY